MLSDLRSDRLLLSLKTPAKSSLMTLLGRAFVWKLVYDVILVRCADLVVDVFQIAVLLCGRRPPHVSWFNILQIGVTLHWLERKTHLRFEFILVVLSRLGNLMISLNRFAESWDIRHKAWAALFGLIFLIWDINLARSSLHLIHIFSRCWLLKSSFWNLLLLWFFFLLQVHSSRWFGLPSIIISNETLVDNCFLLLTYYFLLELFFHYGFSRIISNLGVASLTLALFKEVTFLLGWVWLGFLELPLLVKKLVAAFLDVEHLVGFGCILRKQGVIVL